MPRIRIKNKLLKNDWRNDYNNDKINIMNLLKSKVQSGGSKVQSGGSVFKIISLIISIILSVIVLVVIIFLLIVLINAINQKYVKRNPEYTDLNVIDMLKKSLFDILDIILMKKKNKTNKINVFRTKEVYNLGNNKFNYEEAQTACSMLGGRLATREELKGAYNKGAEWCNYGWSNNGEALYPTQEKTYRMLKKAGRENECGVPGINGGYFPDKDMKLGANCYGVKPSPDNDNLLNVDCNNPKVVQLLDVTTGQFGIKYSCPEKEKAANFTNVINDILPFNNYTWSRESDSNKLYIGNNSLSRNGLRYETFESKPMIEKNDLIKAFKQILEYLKGEIKTGDSLKRDIRSVLSAPYSKTADTKKIVDVALNKIMDILKKHNIPLDNAKIDNAIEYYDHSLINKMKRDIDYILTPASINGIYNKYKITLGK